MKELRNVAILIFTMLVVTILVSSLNYDSSNPEFRSIKRLEEENMIQDEQLSESFESIVDDQTLDFDQKYAKMNEVVLIEISELKNEIDTIITDLTDLNDDEQVRLDDINARISQEQTNELIDENVVIFNDYQTIKTDLDTLANDVSKRLEAEAEAERKRQEKIEREKQEQLEAEEAAKEQVNLAFDNNVAVEGNFDRGSASSLFAAINEYRASIGLAPYAYATNQQSCVDIEASAYAATQNPHNWLCEAAANENASIVGVGQNITQISMNFFVNDPPHEAVLSGNYSSAAVSVYVSSGMNYIIVDVFY